MTTIEIICVVLYYYIATIASGIYLLYNVKEKRTLLAILNLLFGWGIFLLLAGQFIGNCFLLVEKRINKKNNTK